MHKFLALTLLILLISCSEDDSPPITDSVIGTWKLTETLVDPGDGSGVFQAVQSTNSIIFSEDFTFSSIGSVCTIDIASSLQSKGTYDTSQMVLIPDECAIQNSIQLRLPYKIDDQGNLVVNLICIEGCALKYRRVAISSAN